MAEFNFDISEFPAGIVRRRGNLLGMPKGSLTDGLNVQLMPCLKTRPGCLQMSHATLSGLPYSEIQAVFQARLPSSEATYILVQAKQIANPNTYVLGADGGAGGVNRAFHTSVIRTSTGLMYSFGGYDGGFVVDTLAVYDPSTEAWTNLTPTGGPPTARCKHVAIHDPVGDRMIVYGGADEAMGISFSDVWEYAYTANTWTELTYTGTVGERYDADGFYRDGHLYIQGGFSLPFSGQGGTPARLNLSTLVWSDFVLTDAPGENCNDTDSRGGHTILFDATGDTFYVLGGYNSDAWLTGDAWQFASNGYHYCFEGDFTDIQWHWIALNQSLGNSSENGYGIQDTAGVVYSGHYVYLFGDPGLGPSTYDGYYYTRTGDTWTPITVPTGGPDPRAGHTMCLTADGTILMYGGFVNGTDYVGQVWHINAAALVGG